MSAPRAVARAPRQMPAQRILANDQRQPQIDQLGQHLLSPRGRATWRRRQITGLAFTFTRVAKRHRHDGNPAGFIERCTIDTHPVAQADRRWRHRNMATAALFGCIANGTPWSCTLRPGAWPAIRIRALRCSCRTGRGSCSNSSAHKRQVLILAWIEVIVQPEEQRPDRLSWANAAYGSSTRRLSGLPEPGCRVPSDSACCSGRPQPLLASAASTPAASR